MPDFELSRPTSLAEALKLIAGDDPGVRPMGGGTALALMMKAGFLAPVHLVSLGRVPELHGIALDSDLGEVRIGATTTFAELEHSTELNAELPVIRRAMRDLANVRVRNVATVGGNLAHADPHLDLPPIWAALGAEATLARPGGERVVAVEDISLGYYESCIEPGEMITGIRVPLKPGARSTYVKVTTRAAHDWPALGLALQANFDGMTVTGCRVVLSAATDRPIRLKQAEAALTGADIVPSTLADAGDAAVADAGIVSDGRGSSDYKNHLLRVHLGRALRALAGNAMNGDSHAHA